MMGPVVFQMFRWATSIVTVVYIVYEWPILIKRHWPIKLLVLMAICYPAGKALEFWLVGPELLRAHLADFGFVPFVAWFGYDSSILSRLREPWRRWLVFATAMLIAAAGVEGFELVYQPLEVAKHIPTRGDWGDMASYFISYVLLLVIVRIQVLKLRTIDAQVKKIERATAELDRAQLRAARRARRGQSVRPGRHSHTRGPVGRKRG